MCETIKCFFIDMLYENGVPSLTRFLALVAYASFLLASFYMIIRVETWSGYETFANLTAGGGSALQILNKFINSKYNSPSEQFPEKGGGSDGSRKSQKDKTYGRKC